MTGSNILRVISITLLIAFGVTAGNAVYSLGFGIYGAVGSLIAVSIVGALIWTTQREEMKERQRALATIPNFEDKEIVLPKNIVDARETLKQLKQDREALIQAYITLYQHLNQEEPTDE